MVKPALALLRLYAVAQCGVPAQQPHGYLVRRTRRCHINFRPCGVARLPLLPQESRRVAVAVIELRRAAQGEEVWVGLVIPRQEGIMAQRVIVECVGGLGKHKAGPTMYDDDYDDNYMHEISMAAKATCVFAARAGVTC